jgi:hypothetical protein
MPRWAPRTQAFLCVSEKLGAARERQVQQKRGGAVGAVCPSQLPNVMGADPCRGCTLVADCRAISSLISAAAHAGGEAMNRRPTAMPLPLTAIVNANGNSGARNGCHRRRVRYSTVQYHS